MIYLILDVNAIEGTKPLLINLFGSAVTAIEYSELRPEAIELDATLVFTGASLFRSRRKDLAILAERRLPKTTTVLNRPSKVRARHPSNLAPRRSWPVETFARATFPVSLRADHPAGNIDSPPIYEANDLKEVLAEMILGSYAIEDIWAFELDEASLADRLTVFRVRDELFGCPPSLCSQVLSAFKGSSVDVGKLEFTVQDGQIVPWRLDDGPSGLLPPSSLAEQWLKEISKY